LPVQFHDNDDGDFDVANWYRNRYNMNGQEEKKTVWSNPNNQKLEKVRAIVPCSLLFTMHKIEQLMSFNAEFGLYLKGEIIESVLIISEEYYIPLQEVTSASIDFKEDGNLQWNGIIHKHPTGCTGFSGVDDGSINENHLFTLLYESKEIKKGEINLKIKDISGKIRMPLDIEIEFPSVNVSKKDVEEKITQRSVVSNQPIQIDHQNFHHGGNRNHPRIWRNGDFFPRGVGIGQPTPAPTIEHGNHRGNQGLSGISDSIVKQFETQEGRDCDPRNLNSWETAGIFTKLRGETDKIDESKGSGHDQTVPDQDNNDIQEL
jgi:hypothetical protein